MWVSQMASKQLCQTPAPKYIFNKCGLRDMLGASQALLVSTLSIPSPTGTSPSPTSKPLEQKLSDFANDFKDAAKHFEYKTLILKLNYMH